MFYRLLKKPFFSRFMVNWRNPIQEDERHEWANFSIQSKSGGQIRGLFAKALSPNTKATIVLGHPMGKEAKAYYIKRGYTDLLRKHGYNTLLFDLNGFGESSHGNFFYHEDILAVGNFAKQLTSNLPIGYIGVSLGGQWAMISFTDKNHPYDFAIIESAATSLKEFCVQFPKYHKMLKLLSFLFPKKSKQVNMLERSKEIKNLKSLLLIYSLADKWVSPSMGKRYKDNSPVPTELWVTENATHANFMNSEDKEEYKNKIIEYLDSMSMNTSYVDEKITEEYLVN